jgi:hypothetical protein
MEFEFIDNGVNAVVVDNFYTEEQLQEIMTELKWLTKNSILVAPEDTGSAENEFGSVASKSGIFLEQVFKNWRHSALISHSITQLNSKEFVDSLTKHNELYKILFYCNSRSHLLSYYENSDFYKPHTDACVFTALNYFHTEPKQWEGGEMVLSSFTSDKNATVEIRNNRIILITSNTFHGVNEIKSKIQKVDGKYSGNGRYCNSIFLTRNDNKEFIAEQNGSGKGKYVQKKEELT